MRTNILSFASIALLMLATEAQAQNFNHTKGYIFDQPYVTRIKEPVAAEKLHIKNAGEWLLEQHYSHDKNRALPKGVQRLRNTLVFNVAGKPNLRLTSFVYRGKDDGGDSQKFVYIQSSENHHIVCVEFDHDAPGFLLIEKDSLKVYFVDH